MYYRWKGKLVSILVPGYYLYPVTVFVFASVKMSSTHEQKEVSEVTFSLGCIMCTTE